MCLSRPGARSISGLSRALRTNGATALTRCTSSSSTVGTSASQQAPGVRLAQIDLLLVLVEQAARKEAGCRPLVLSEKGRLAQAGGGEQSGVRRRRVTRGPGRAAEGMAVAKVLIARQEPAGGFGHGFESSGLAGHHVLEERGRAAHRLAGVVDQIIEPPSAADELPAEGLDTRDVSQIETEDLQPIRPVVEVGLVRVPNGSVPREPGADDQAGAAAQ